ncbi:MAG: hypothetical protein R3D67_15130 [Hyphomicrobiaceae bacterium]
MTTINRVPSIETTKTAAVTVANGLSATATDAGDVVTYTITIRNTGNTTLTAVGLALRQSHQDWWRRSGVNLRADVRVEFR